MIVGIALESQIRCSPTACILAILACGMFALIGRIRTRHALLLVIVVATSMGALRHHLAFRSIAATNISQFASKEKQLAKVTGTVSIAPRIRRTGYAPFEPWLHTTDRTFLTIDTEQIDIGKGRQEATGRLHISISKPALAVQEGDRIQVTGWLRELSPPRNPGQFDWSLFNARRGARARLHSSQTENIEIVQAAGQRGRSLANRFRKLLLGSGIDSGDKSSTLLDTMVLGHRSAVDKKIERLFLETGCAHYLAVSGIHIAMLASLVWFPARFFGADRRVAAALLIAAVVAYVAIADARPSMLRAAVMACTYSFALLLRRQGNTFNTLSIAAVLLLSVNPLALFDIGFQLSFVAVTGIVLLTPTLTSACRFFVRHPVKQGESDSLPADARNLPIGERPAATWAGGILRRAGLLLCVSIAAWISTLPVVAFHFSRVTPTGWLSSTIAFPFVFVVMILSFSKLAVGMAIPLLAPMIGVPLTFATELLRDILKLARSILGSPIDVTPPSVLTILAYYGCVCALVYYLRRGWSPRGRVLVLILALIAIATWCWPTRSSGTLTITQLAVGRGTSTLIELPDGNAWLYDAGASGASDPGEFTILPLLHERNIKRLAGVVITHANLDHFGGLPSVLKHKSCQVIHLNTNGPPDPEDRDTPFDTLLQTLQESNQKIIALHAGDTLDWGENMRVQVLWPPNDTKAHFSKNDQSIVIRLEYKNRSVLMTGDIGFAPQQWLMENCDLNSDVLILPHHGAIEENTAAFIAAVNPSFLIRSSFVKNAESPDLKRIAGTLPLFNTAERGAITITIDNNQVVVSSYLKPPR